MTDAPFSPFPMTRLSISALIMVPVMLLSLLGILLGSYAIESSMEKELQTISQKHVEEFANKIYYTFRSNYQTLFYNFGEDPERFASASDAARKEVINTLKQSLLRSENSVFIVAPDQVIPLTPRGIRLQDVVTPETWRHARAKDRFFPHRDFFIYTKYFAPWQWHLVVLEKKSAYETLVTTNRNMIILIIALLILVILVFLRWMIRHIIDKPLARIIAHLQRLGQGDYTSQLHLPWSREIHQLSEKINDMSLAIAIREKKLASEKQTTENILNAQQSIVLVTDGGDITRVNRAFFDFFDQYKNFEHFKSQHQCICELFEPTDEEGYIYNYLDRSWIDVLLERNTPQKVKISQQGESHIFSISLRVFPESDLQQYVITLTDITEIEQHKRELEHSRDTLNRQMHTDTLTGLPNRTQLLEDIARTETASLILIDINRFKQINDFFGHDVGDTVLVQFSRNLQNFPLLDRGCILYRLSGDEFGLLSTSNLSREAHADFAQHLAQHLNRQHYTISGEEIAFGVAIGYTTQARGSEVIIQADLALKTAKETKKATSAYQESLLSRETYAENLTWFRRLKRAVDSDRIVPHFQIIQSTNPDTPPLYESLVRMVCEDGTVIAASAFIDIAKQSYLYRKLSEIMVAKTFQYFEHRPYRFSLNLSTLDLSNPQFVSYLIRQIDAHGVGERLIIELVESEKVRDYDAVADFITRLRQYGCTFALDDFGSGFSNFTHAFSLHIDYLKIDGSLIENIVTDPTSRILVEAIVAFARKLDMQTIAEFVSDAAIETQVRAMGIDYLQGYHTGRPQPTLDGDGSYVE